MYAIQTQHGFFAGIDNQHMVAASATDVAYAKTWKTRKGAERYLAEYADCGFGLNSDSASVVFIREDLYHDDGAFRSDYNASELKVIEVRGELSELAETWGCKSTIKAVLTAQSK